MRILLVASAFNSLTQRVHAELSACGHVLEVVPDGADDAVGRPCTATRPS